MVKLVKSQWRCLKGSLGGLMEFGRAWLRLYQDKPKSVKRKD